MDVYTPPFLTDDDLNQSGVFNALSCILKFIT